VNLGSAAQKVLVVADDQIAAKTLASIIRGAGYETFEALDGEDAVSLARNETPGLIVLDISSDTFSAPWDGYRIMEWMRRMKVSRGVPVIIVADNAQDFDVERAVDAGTCGILYKPLNQGELLRLVCNVLEASVIMAA